jgi:hypothetical protein
MKDLMKKDNSFSGFPVPMLPPAIPPIEYRSGIGTLVENWLHNKKLEQIDKAKALEASIARNSCEAFRSQCDMMMEFLTFGQRYQTTMESLKNRTAMEQEMINRQKLENQKLYLETKGLELDNKKQEFEYQQMLKAAEHEPD